MQAVINLSLAIVMMKKLTRTVKKALTRAIQVAMKEKLLRAQVENVKSLIVHHNLKLIGFGMKR
jgi:hypothetical protein